MSDTETFHGLTLSQWCNHAKNRRPVDVYAHGRIIRATLIAWRPRRKGHRDNTARVEYASGRQASVKVRFVTPVLDATAD